MHLTFVASRKKLILLQGGHEQSKFLKTVALPASCVSDPVIVTYPCAFRFFTVSREGIHKKTSTSKTTTR
jgi:hypothetical protein